MSGYNFAFLDEQTKRMIRRAVLKAVAIPGYQVPFGSREMPLSYGWGTGGVQITASLIGPDEVLKVIDQGADDTTNAVSIRQFFERTDRRAHHHAHRRGHAHPEPPPHPRDAAPRRADPGAPGADPGAAALARAPRGGDAPHARAGGVRRRCTCGSTRTSRITARSRPTYDYPVRVNGRYLMRPSPIPKFDNPKLDGNPALLLFGGGPGEADLRGAAAHLGEEPRLRGPSVRGRDVGPAVRALRRRRRVPRRDHRGRQGRPDLRRAPTPTTAQRRRRRAAMAGSA